MHYQLEFSRQASEGDGVVSFPVNRGLERWGGAARGHSRGRAEPGPSRGCLPPVPPEPHTRAGRHSGEEQSRVCELLKKC